MESVALTHAVFAANRRNPVNPVRLRKRIQWQPSRFRTGGMTSSKKSDFQDFQGYAKPLRLLPATEVEVFTGKSEKESFSCFNLDESQSLFKVKMETSNIYGSSLSDLNAGVLLCLIDENGDSVLQIIPANLVTAHFSESVDPERLGFQSGSVDEFTFLGPKLRKITALWVSLESGQWRLREMSLTVLNTSENLLNKNGEEKTEFVGFQYDFETDDLLIGEGGEVSMVELIPSLVTEISGIDPFALLSRSTSQSTSPNETLSNEESMKQYADLKLSLLFYDAILVFVGTSVSSLSFGEGSGIAFLYGGIIGFLYLLLLQRSVDGLQVPRNPEENDDQIIRGFKGPLLSLALAIGISAIAVKYSGSTGDVPVMFTAKEVLGGMMGFLACKIAVVLAAFKPMTLNLKENK